MLVVFLGYMLAGTPFKKTAWDTLSSEATGGLIGLEASERAGSFDPERY